MNPYQFIIGEGIPAPLTPLYLASTGLVHPIAQLVPAQVRRYVGLSKTARVFSATEPRTVNVYQDNDLISIADLSIGLEYHLGLTGPVLLASLTPISWSLRVGSARSSGRLLYKQGDAGLVAQLLAESITWQHFTATAGQRIFSLAAPPWSVFFVLYDGAVLAPGSGLFTWVSGSTNVELTFDAATDAKVSIAIR